MRILVTGAFGYLGSRISRLLLKNGHNLKLGSRRSREIPSDLIGATAIEIDWENRVSIQEACEGVDVVLHLAGMSANDCLNQVELAIKANGIYTYRLLDASKNARVKSFIYFSTIHAYSSDLRGDIFESTPLNSSHPYGFTHEIGEKCVNLFVENNSLNAKILRLANVFGCPGSDDVEGWHLVVNDLCRQAIESGQLELKNSSQARDFITMTGVLDLVEKIIAVDQEQIPRVLNISSGSVMTVMQIAQIIKQRCKDLYNLDIKISSKNEKTAINSHPFRIDNTLLSNSVLRIFFNLQDEIDQLLNFCMKKYGK